VSLCIPRTQPADSLDGKQSTHWTSETVYWSEIAGPPQDFQSASSQARPNSVWSIPYSSHSPGTMEAILAGREPVVAPLPPPPLLLGVQIPQHLQHGPLQHGSHLGKHCSRGIAFQSRATCQSDNSAIYNNSQFSCPIQEV
jgi:hypothetical protein